MANDSYLLVVNNRKIYIVANLLSNMGKAYGFFNCTSSKDTIEAELPTICELAQIPSELELSLIEGMDNLEGDSDLISLAQRAKKEGIRYVLEASYSGASNKETADEVAGILNQAYQTPLYQDGEPFQGVVIYKEGDKYVFRGD